MYTYEDLLAETEQKKLEWWKQTRKALKGPAGFLVKAEIERKPGATAWAFLAREFCEKLAEHIDEWMTDDPWDLMNKEMSDVYMAYEDGDSNIYDLLPTEARLFDI